MTISSTPETGARGGRGWFIALGIALIVLGLIALWNVVDTTLVTTIFIGWLLVIGGVFNVVGAFTTNVGLGWRLVHALLGLLYVLVGFNLALDPFSGAITLTIVLGALLISDGIFRIVGAFMDRRDDTVWMVVLAVVNILFGLWILTGIPMSGVVIGVYVGVQLVVAGIAWLVAGFMGSVRSEMPASA
jgi:uncharacterized membrane protein HdeD (DUF308 family)